MSLFISTGLDSSHLIEDFRCGNVALDAWLHNVARRANQAGVSRVTVWHPTDRPEQIVAYFAISPAVVAAGDGLPRKAAGGFSYVPAWLLGRLAVDVRYQGQGIGRDVLFDAIETIVSVAAVGGGRLIVVDPIDSTAAAWYQQFGFVPFGPSQNDRPARQYLLVEQALDAISADRS